MYGKIATPKAPVITAGLLLLGALLALPPLASSEVVELPGLAYEVNNSLADNLKALTGKKVHLSLAGGASLTGSVKAVGNELLHLEKLEGKEYFDALVRLADIAAVDTRFRDLQR
ncbi:MAG: hypothetical protein HGA96_10795 [Desulfobulbaceae bacterium]|nr:hypothetical protein [Desulfobulbaceae bacterium]